jgi:hypothetical protein
MGIKRKIKKLPKVKEYLPSFFLTRVLANSKQITRNPKPTAEPSTIATVLDVG